MHNFIVGEGQHEVFAESIEEREGELVVLIATKNRILGKILERVIHPAHVPFEAETEAAKIRGA